MTSHTVQPAAFSAASEFAERTVRTAEGTLGYRECGSGPQAIVLLHGISSGSGSWLQCALALARHARVIAWDAPGYGASAALSSPTPLAPQYAARLHHLLGALDVDQCLLVGHSLGALMAAAYSAVADHRARGFVLASPALGYQGARSARAAQVRQDRLAALQQLGISGLAARLPERLLTSRADQAAHETVRSNALRLHPWGYAQAVELLCAEDIDRYSPPAGSTLVCCGQQDIVTTPEQSSGYAQRHGFEFALIPGAGHACYVERPQETSKLIIDALLRLNASGSTT